jgi:hypothetical protein
MSEFRVSLFDMGNIVATPGAIAALVESGTSPVELLARHIAGDWGDVSREDKALNDQSVKDGSRILSAYLLNTGVSVWIITEADRSTTTFLLPEEY